MSGKGAGWSIEVTSRGAASSSGDASAVIATSARATSALGASSVGAT